jgi:hypothetical protein
VTQAAPEPALERVQAAALEQALALVQVLVTALDL